VESRREEIAYLLDLRSPSLLLRVEEATWIAVGVFVWRRHLDCPLVDAAVRQEWRSAVQCSEAQVGMPVVQESLQCHTHLVYAYYFIFLTLYL
jgi:hypothetical protein